MFVIELRTLVAACVKTFTMEHEDLDRLTNMRRLSMIEIEETLSELKNNIFSWSSLTSESREGLEPLRALIVL